jgi:hypothetical protein
MTAAATRPALVAASVLAMAAACALLLALPGATVTTAYVNDLFIFLDGAHRIASGQVPNRDFHTALGPLVYYLPAAGLLLSGSFGAAMPVAAALAILALAPAFAHILGSRLRPALALPYGAFLILILAVPMNLGEGVNALSFGMFYNRVGWAALAALLVMYLQPQTMGRRQHWFDALSAAALVLAMLYLKITYGLVALAFVVFMLLDAAQRRSAGLALVITLGIALIVEAFWQSSAAHVADLLRAGEVSGGLRGLEAVVSAVLYHLTDYVLFGLLTGLALWRKRSVRDLLFYAFCAVTGLLIIIQNSQPWGIISLHAGGVVAAEALMRRRESTAREWRLATAAPLLMLALVLPTIVHCTITLGLHAILAATKSGEDFGLPRFDRIRLAKLWSPFDYEFSARYVASLREGAAIFSRLDAKPSHVAVLDFVNPFSAGLGLAPARGDASWQHWGRNVDATRFMPPEQLFGDVRMIMEPKWGVNADPLRDLYGAYIAANFDLIEETEGWRVHLSRRWRPGEPPQATTVSSRIRLQEEEASRAGRAGLVSAPGPEMSETYPAPR